MQPVLVLKKVGPPLVEVLCGYEVLAMRLRHTRYQRWCPTLSHLTGQVRWKLTNPGFWVAAGLFVWLVWHLWFEEMGITTEPQVRQGGQSGRSR